MRFLAVFMLFLSSSSYAVLPPELQRQAEIDRIRTSHEVLKSLDGEEIVSIVHVDSGDSQRIAHQYLVHSGSKTTKVRVHYLPSYQEGPVEFDLQVVKESLTDQVFENGASSWSETLRTFETRAAFGKFIPLLKKAALAEAQILRSAREFAQGFEKNRDLPQADIEYLALLDNSEVWGSEKGKVDINTYLNTLRQRVLSKLGGQKIPTIHVRFLVAPDVYRQIDRESFEKQARERFADQRRETEVALSFIEMLDVSDFLAGFRGVDQDLWSSALVLRNYLALAEAFKHRDPETDFRILSFSLIPHHLFMKDAVDKVRAIFKKKHAIQIEDQKTKFF